mgnify:CR=1 FL=1
MQEPVNKYNIMVIDDEENNIKTIELAFKNHDYNFISYTDPNSALDYLINNTPDILLLDIMMPEINGIELAKIIKQKGIETPIIFLTSLSDLETKKNAYSIGIDDYINKPFLEDELINKVSKKLDYVSRIKESVESWNMIKGLIEDILPHEINTPLSGVILGLSEIENQKENFKSEITKFIDFIENNVPELRELNFFIYLKKNLKVFLDMEKDLKRIVDTSIKRLERLVKKIIFYNAKFSLKKTKVNTKTLISNIIKEYNHKISTDLEDITAYLDYELIKESIKVLIDNSLVHNQNFVNISVKCHIENKRLLVSVEDNGVGIKAENIPYIFKPYYIAHNVLNHSEGFGLGLYFVKKVIDAHNGNIEVYSRLREKTIFTIKLDLD